MFNSNLYKRALASAVAIFVAATCVPQEAEAIDALGLCLTGKLKASGRHAKKVSKCQSKNAKVVGSVSVPTCVAKEEDKTDLLFRKSELKSILKGGVCPATMDMVDLTGPAEWLSALYEDTLLPPHNALPNKCVATKIDATGKLADKLSKCTANNVKKPDAGKFAACKATHEQKLREAFAKADTKFGPCASLTDEDTIVEVNRVVERQLYVLRFGDGILIDAPANGSFTNASSVTVTGMANGAEPVTSLSVNGSSVLPLDPDNAYSTTVPLSANDVFNPIVAELTTQVGTILRDRVTQIVGDGVNTGFVLDGQLAPQSIAMRFTDTGLQQIEPIVATLSGDALDIETLLTAQNPVLDDECVFEVAGLCWYFATVNIVEVGFSSFELTFDAEASGSTAVDVTINDFFVDIDLHIRDQVAVNFDCGLEITTNSTGIDGNYDMVPFVGNPSKVDVNQVGNVAVSLVGFNHAFTSGLCNVPVIGDIIQAIVGGSIQGMVQGGFESNLNDPDGGGPLDSPIAGGIQGALDGIDIAGPVGETIGVNLDAQFFQITEDANGISFNVDSSITAANPDPLAPDIAASYSVAEPFPAFGNTTPIGGLPYGMGLGISTTAFNMLLKAEIESGLLRNDITEFDLGGGALPLTVGLIKTFIPELDGQFADAEPVEVRLRPVIAPIVTGQPGPLGELAELRMSHLIVDMVVVNPDFLALRLAVDVDLGLDLVASPTGLGFSIGLPAPEDVNIDILDNPLNSNEVVLQTFLSSFLPLAFPGLADALGGFPLPSFLGLELDPVEVSRAGEFMTIYANLNLP